MFVLHNALIVPEYMFQMNYKNRAFQYGDGFFETMIYDGTKIRFFNDHYDRIEKAIEAFGLSYPEKFTKEGLHNNIVSLVEKNALHHEARIKLMIYRSEGGLFIPEDNEFELLMTASRRTAPSSEFKKKVDFYNEFPVQLNPVSAFKTMSALQYVFAGVFAKRHGLDEVILLNDEGYIAECLSTNLYWIKNDVLFTPSVDTGCVSGVMRKQLLSSARANDINVKQGKFKREDLMEADFVFNSNVTGFHVIQNIEGTSFKTDHPIFETLKEDILKSY